MAFHWGLSESKSPQVSRTRLCILPDLSNAVFWMLLACPSILHSSSFFTYSLEIVLVWFTSCDQVIFLYLKMKIASIDYVVIESKQSITQ